MRRLASDVRSAAALRSVVAKVADAAAAHLGGRELPHIRNAACQLLLALARLDSDALWLLLFRLSAQVISCPCLHFSACMSDHCSPGCSEVPKSGVRHVSGALKIACLGSAPHRTLRSQVEQCRTPGQVCCQSCGRFSQSSLAG